ncbi:MAG: helix-turn-helix domain-containing protein [Candidatus ainarchaeum sp.]|nr:helix-turn-helix domain-containing protein [Candidatus ainarchaeum sp.]
MRETVLRGAASLLERKGFQTFTCSGTHACFDLVARRGSELFLVKALENVDAFSGEQARDMAKIASMFGSRALLLGEATKEGKMLDGVLYERHAIPTVTVRTLGGIVEGEFPEARKFKVLAFAIDSGKLAGARRKKKLKMGALAEASGISRVTLSRYERGETGASEENLEKLEGVLGTGLRKPIDPFQAPATGAPVDEETAFSFLGFTCVKAESAPFEIAARHKRRLFAGEEADRRTMKKRAEIYANISGMLDSLPCFLLAESKANQINGIPVLRVGELKRIREERELLKLLQERSE